MRSQNLIGILVIKLWISKVPIHY